MKNVLDYLTWEHVELGVRITRCDKSFKGALEVPVLIDGRPVVEIGACAFSHCCELEELRLGAGIKKIENGAFNSCISLKSVEIPGTVESVGMRAFYDCFGLEELHLGAGIKKIEKEAFCRCSSLKSVEIPDTVESVGEGAFRECPFLRRVVDPFDDLTVSKGLDYHDFIFWSEVMDLNF